LFCFCRTNGCFVELTEDQWLFVQIKEEQMVSSFVEMKKGQMVPQWTDFILKKFQIRNVDFRS